MKRIIKLTIIILLIAFLLPSAVLANGGPEPITIFPLIPNHYASPDQPLIIRLGWWACTKGLVQSWLTSMQHTYYLEGEKLVTIDRNYDAWTMENWGPLEGCMSEKGTDSWAARYTYPIGTGADYGLEIGDELHFKADLCRKHPVTDGFDLDDNGIPDVYGKGCSQFNFTVHMISP
jgi:hypothetical protein